MTIEKWKNFLKEIMRGALHRGVAAFSPIRISTEYGSFRTEQA